MVTRRDVMAGLAVLLAGPVVAGPVVAGPVVAGPARGLSLMMVRRKGCVYCAEWDREIAPVYGQHAGGRAAPVFMVDVDGPYPDGLALARRPWLSPTFILLQGGVEMARFDGYPGADKFFAVLDDMIRTAGQTAR